MYTSIYQADRATLLLNYLFFPFAMQSTYSLKILVLVNELHCPHRLFLIPSYQYHLKMGASELFNRIIMNLFFRILLLFRGLVYVLLKNCKTTICLNDLHFAFASLR